MHLGLDASTIKCLSSMREALWTSPYCNEKKKSASFPPGTPFKLLLSLWVQQ